MRSMYRTLELELSRKSSLIQMFIISYPVLLNGIFQRIVSIHKIKHCKGCVEPRGGVQFCSATWSQESYESLIKSSESHNLLLSIYVLLGSYFSPHFQLSSYSSSVPVNTVLLCQGRSWFIRQGFSKKLTKIQTKIKRTFLLECELVFDQGDLQDISLYT